ncbi:PspC domain-containing protein [Micromonospora terminaliae]|uniref:PspC domain-containing protein n=1 Tax=Micromonospora terminaliae TaxID=1914461 RepID=A0AAJ2ZJT8_9ACTN|nr:PspC domain-containing protein [Micromonospora terminaliae]NES31125.1 PspC domain-containing protein [Micromonospora terminaliae]QGL49390.1 PspC domain-containing protein [Micromonospora terminaliae]
MTEDAARPPRPGAAAQDGPPPPPPGTAPTAADATAPPPPGSVPPPTGGGPSADPPPTGYAPPPGGAGFTSRYGLVRPREGRYLAGVCAAIGRATNTDPVLWRVLLAVLGFFGGIGILVYVTAWLIIPGEGDTASPVESMLGRGRSSMSPITVIVLSIVVAVGFGYVVTNGFRAILLGAVILIGGALLLNRDQRGPATRTAAPGAPAGPPPGPVPPVAWPAPPAAAPAPGTPAAAGPVPPPATPSTPWPGTPAEAAAAPWSGAPAEATPWSGEPPVTAPPAARPEPGYPPAPVSTAGWPATTVARPAWSEPEPAAARPPAVPGTRSGEAWSGTETAWSAAPTTGRPYEEPAAVPPPAPVGAPLPPGGYRPPFAPHGPYAGSTPLAPPAPTRPAKSPKRPKERSALGAVTFSLIFLALGVVAMLDLLDAFPVGAAGYFAAVLATIGLGLLVGTWFGRARWLIALGLVTAAALGIATVAESYDRVRGIDGDVTWAPADYRDLADRYENNFGDAVLDLRAVDFDKKDTQVTVEINFGKATVVVPPNVDVTTVADVNAGDADVFGRRTGGLNGRQWENTDLGPDGRGGGTLRLVVHVNAGNLEVTR